MALINTLRMALDVQPWNTKSDNYVMKRHSVALRCSGEALINSSEEGAPKPGSARAVTGDHQPWGPG